MKIIYAPGFLEGREQFFLLKWIFSAHELLYFKYDTGLKEEISVLAGQLKQFIASLNLKKNEKIAIIGFSAGGIIADYYLKYIDNRKVGKFISVCAPVHGTFLANICSKKRIGLQQLKSGSEFLAKLAGKRLRNAKKLSIWCPHDIIVSGKPSKYENSAVTAFFLHVFAPCWPPITSKINAYLSA